MSLYKHFPSKDDLILAVLQYREEGVLELKTKLATASGGRRGGTVPTVEAVENTIRKMTLMAEERSGDVDVLEQQMRRLGMSTDGDSRPGSSRRPPRGSSGSPRCLPDAPPQRARPHQRQEPLPIT